MSAERIANSIANKFSHACQRNFRAFPGVGKGFCRLRGEYYTRNTKGKEGIVIVMWKEFKAFAFKGNVIDMAVGVMIGGAFSKIVTSLVNDIFMPLLSVLTGKIDFSTLYISLDGKEYASYQAAVDANAAMFRYGSFLQSVLDFLLISICIFAFVKLVSRLHKKPEAPPPAPARKCPYCYGEIDEHATRCPHCTSELPPAEMVEKA